MSEINSFHAQEGLTFGRLPDGSVRVQVHAGLCAIPTFETDLSPTTWASAIAAVSRSGDTAEQFQAALEFHQIYDHDEGAEPLIEKAENDG
jgi:hypothetical protein